MLDGKAPVRIFCFAWAAFIAELEALRRTGGGVDELNSQEMLLSRGVALSGYGVSALGPLRPPVALFARCHREPLRLGRSDGRLCETSCCEFCIFCFLGGGLYYMCRATITPAVWRWIVRPGLPALRFMA